ncbi:hypothetical protein FOMPIDRAFT_1026230 [Fomitopsis schrenkii]|uniref:Uncharacterized protein n=1 Tax=Fomitopsis schrenkii TaxID=2126942 RepID=S8DP34_FOMSC|nr:hypothetical protein FOMPIDRAFT_1026230 [Fomitopsis schrenkii]
MGICQQERCCSVDHRPDRIGRMTLSQASMEPSCSLTEEYNQANDGTAFYAMSLGYGQSTTEWRSCHDTVRYDVVPARAR